MAGYNPHQGLLQQAFLASIGIGMDVPVTGMSDGGEDIRHACQLPAAAERALDWFHIGMRFEHLLVPLRGLRGAAAQQQMSAPSSNDAPKVRSGFSGTASGSTACNALNPCAETPAGQAVRIRSGG